jgi:hypothetical protein
MSSGMLVRLQVKQSAARQAWITKKTSAPSFRIAAKSGYHAENGDWIPEKGRHAEIFVFGWHGDSSKLADQFDAKQWIFYVVTESQLREEIRKNILLSDVKKFAAPTEFVGLKDKVEKVALSIGSQSTLPSPPATS